MRVADAWRAEEQHVFGLDQKSAGSHLAHQALVDRRTRHRSPDDVE